LFPRLKRYPPDLALRISHTSNPIISLFFSSAEIGDLPLCDDGDHATVIITGITHGDFGAYDENLNTEEKEHIITEDVISFLVTLFSDRVVLCRTSSKGHRRLTVIEQGVKDIEFVAGREYFVWSGPITPPKA
jgi:hypothetical protein